MTQNYAQSARTPVGLAANGTQQVYNGLPIFSYGAIGKIPYDTLCIKADFKCQLQNYLIRSGNYGLRVIITTEKEVIDLSLDSAQDMFGNPYGFISYFTQEQTYHLNLEGSIQSIKGYFYQRGNFTYYDNTEVIDPMVPVLKDKDGTEIANIFINNIQLYFGYDVSQIADDTVEIYTPDSDYYVSDGNLSKTMHLIWFNKTEENKYLGFTDGVFNKAKAKSKERDPNDTNIYYWVEWYRDNNDKTWPMVKESGSTNANGQVTYVGTCHDLYSETVFKARVYCNGNYYESNELKFINQTLANADSSNALDMALTIHHGEHSEDAYPYYGADNVLVNIADARRARQLYFSYESTVGALLEDSVLDGARVLWYIPTAATMLEPSYKNTYEQLSQEVLDAWKVETLAALGNVEPQVKLELQEQLETQFNGYLPPAGMACYYTTIEGAVDQSEKTFYYQIKKVFNANGVNNKIKLKVIDKFGYEYNADKSFIFSTSGSCGTDYSLIISEDHGYCSYSGDLTADYNLSAKLYDADFQDITPPPPKLTMDYTVPTSAYAYEIAKAQTDVEWGGKTVQLTAEYPIAWSAGQDYYYQGPVSIVYDSSGVNPQYYNGELAIFDKDNKKLNNVTWEMQYTLNNVAVDQDTIKFLPEIYKNSSKNYSYVKAKSMYMNNLNDVHITLVAKRNGIPIWGQPILIYQNKYSSSLLNKWGGEMVIDHDNNYILTAMIGAGIKNKDNTFSGVLMGDVENKAQDATIPTIGLYGIHEGVQSFGVRIDGTAFLGKSGKGQIILDGNNGFIYSGNWMQSIINEGKNPFITKTINGVERVQLNQGSDGMAIDLQYGHIDAFNFKLTSNNVKFDSHVLNDDAAHGGEEEHFYHMNIETNPLDVKGQLILRKDEVGFRILDGHKYYLDAAGTQEYTGEGYPQKTIIYEKVETTIYTAVQAADWPDKGVGAEITGGPYYWSTDDGQTFSSYSGTTYPTSGLLYTKTIEVSYVRVPDDKSGPLEAGKEYYLDNAGKTPYTDTNFPVAPVLYEQVMRGHGHYHIRFKSDGTLELSIANTTMLADKGITLGDLVSDIDDKFVYIEDEVIGNPENPIPGTIYDHIAGEIGRIEDEVIGVPPGVNAGNVYSYINGQSYMTSEGVFHGLTDGGTKKGIFYRDMPEVQVRVPAVDADGNPVYDANGNRVYELKIQQGKELYINANYIRTGILASSNYVGNLIHYLDAEKTNVKIYKPTNGMSVEEVVAAAVARGEDDWDIGTWGLVAEQGTYWNLDNGQLWAAKFELNAWKNCELNDTGDGLETDSAGGGLYLNSHPELGVDDNGQPLGYYLSVGNTDVTTIGDKVINPNFIQYSAEGVLKVKMNEFVLQASGDVYDDPTNPAFKGIYLNSSPETEEDYYLLIGQPGNFMSLDAKGNMIFQTNNTFIINAWHEPDEHSTYEHGIYINSDGGITKDIYGNEYKTVYFRAGHGDMDSVYDDTSEIIEVSKDRVLIASKNFVLDAYDHDTISVPDGTAEKGGIYLNSAPEIIDETNYDSYLHIGRSDRYIQYTAKHELKMCVDTLIIDAYNNLSADGITEGSSGGLYLNSAPDTNGYYLIVGKPGNFIQLAENGNMTFQTNGKFVIDALSDDRGIYFNSQPVLGSDERHLYFQVGNGDSYIKYSTDNNDENGLLSIKGTVSADAGDLAGWKIEWYNSSCGRIYGTWEENGSTYYLNLWSAFPSSKAGYVAGLYSQNWRIQAGASDNGLNGFTNGFGVTRDGEMAASEGMIAGWEFKSYGLYKLHDDGHTVIAAFLSGDHSEIINGGIYGGSPALDDWGLILGPNFGVSYTEGLFTNKGKIGGWVLDNTDLYYGTSKDDNVTILKGDTGTITTTNLQVYEKLTVDKAKATAYTMRVVPGVEGSLNKPTVDIIGGWSSGSSGEESGEESGEGAVVVQNPLTQINGDILIDGNTEISGTTRLLGVVNIGSSTSAANLYISGKTTIGGETTISGNLTLLSENYSQIYFSKDKTNGAYLNCIGGGQIQMVSQTGTWIDSKSYVAIRSPIISLRSSGNYSVNHQLTLPNADDIFLYLDNTDTSGTTLKQFVLDQSGVTIEGATSGSGGTKYFNGSALYLHTSSKTISLKAPAQATAAGQVLVSSDTTGGTKWETLASASGGAAGEVWCMSASQTPTVGWRVPKSFNLTVGGANKPYNPFTSRDAVTIDLDSAFASKTHNHDDNYAAKSHSHSSYVTESQVYLVSEANARFATLTDLSALAARVSALESSGGSNGGSSGQGSTGLGGNTTGSEVEIMP